MGMARMVVEAAALWATSKSTVATRSPCWWVAGAIVAEVPIPVLVTHELEDTMAVAGAREAARVVVAPQMFVWEVRHFLTACWLLAAVVGAATEPVPLPVEMVAAPTVRTRWAAVVLAKVVPRMRAVAAVTLAGSEWVASARTATTTAAVAAAGMAEALATRATRQAVAGLDTSPLW